MEDNQNIAPTEPEVKPVSIIWGPDSNWHVQVAQLKSGDLCMIASTGGLQYGSVGLTVSADELLRIGQMLVLVAGSHGATHPIFGVVRSQGVTVEEQP